MGSGQVPVFACDDMQENMMMSLYNIIDDVYEVCHFMSTHCIDIVVAQQTDTVTFQT